MFTVRGNEAEQAYHAVANAHEIVRGRSLFNSHRVFVFTVTHFASNNAAAQRTWYKRKM